MISAVEGRGNGNTVEPGGMHIYRRAAHTKKPQHRIGALHSWLNPESRNIHRTLEEKGIKQ